MRATFLVAASATFRRSVLLALTLLALATAHASERAVPIAAFFDNPSLSNAKLSPDGKHLAMLVNTTEGHDQLGVVTLADKSIKVVAAFAGVEPILNAYQFAVTNKYRFYSYGDAMLIA